MPGRNLKEGERQVIEAQGQGAQLSLAQLQQLMGLFQGQQGGIADLLSGNISQLLGINPAGSGPRQVEASNLANRVNLGTAQDLGGQFDAFGLGLDRLSNDINRGRTASGADLRAINSAAEGALGAGLADIRSFRDEGLQSLRNELAPARGLRPGDTPIVDRGGRIVAESNRAADVLSGNIRAQAAQQQLQFPLERRAADLAGLGLQGQFATGQQQFLTALQQQAFQNRLGLAGQLGTSGLNLAGLGLNTANLSGRGLGNTFAPQPPSQGGGFLSEFGGIGGVGALAGGVGGLLTAFSSRDYKEELGNPGAVLPALADLPVKVWRYKLDHQAHIGPYAEEWQDRFGGNGKVISMIDAIGVLIKAVQELNAKMEAR